MQRIVLSNLGNGSVDSILFRTEEKTFYVIYKSATSIQSQV